MLLMGKSTISMAIFNSYVCLPEGIICYYLVFFHWIPIYHEFPRLTIIMALTIINHHNISYHNHQNWSFLSSVESSRIIALQRRIEELEEELGHEWSRATHRATWKAAGPREVGIEKHRKKNMDKILTPEKHRIFCYGKMWKNYGTS